jgi:hypothetical protein
LGGNPICILSEALIILLFISPEVLRAFID